MAQRIIRNDFVAGEISPELWGRHDVDLYYHGAAKIENFVPRRTGGLRKRAGTELVTCFSRSRAEGESTPGTEFRAIPYKYDKDRWGILLLYRDVGGTRLGYSIHSSVTETHTDGALIGADVVMLPAERALSEIRHTQIGDTIFFTFPGATAWKAVITFPTAGTLPSVSWEGMSTSATVARPGDMTAVKSGFGEGEGYQEGKRNYCLWGVKNGVRSAPRHLEVPITLAWKAGAYINISFTPDWTKHDYYILGKLQGGQYGEVSRFYPDGGKDDAIASFPTGTTPDPDKWRTYGGMSGVDPGEGNRYYAVAENPSGWIDRRPNKRTSGGRHVYGMFCHYVMASIATGYRDNPVVGLKLWFGARAYKEDGIHNVGCASETKAAIYFGRRSAPNSDIAWELKQVSALTPGYKADATEIPITTAPASTAEFVRVVFYGGDYVDEDHRGTPYFIPMRGMRVVCTGEDVCTFRDDNIQPGTLVGEQRALTVGQTDMDVNLITAWQQRLVAAGSASLPFTMWFSAIGDLYNYYTDTPQTSDNAFEATIASTEANRINHIVAQKWLLVFTESGEYIISSTGGALAFNTIDVKQLSGVVAHNAIPPVCTESEVLFVAHDGRSVYKMDYTLERDSVVPTNLSIRAEHVAAKSGIVAIAYQRFPDSVLWCLLADGSLASLTFCPEENVCAWAHHTLSGGAGLRAVDIFSTGSVSSVAGTATTSDIFLVLRNDNDPDKTWIERLRPNVIVDSPATETALCADHVGYDSSDIQPLVLREDGTLAVADPKGEISASFETIRMEPQQEDTIGRSAAQFDATLRVLRSGIVAVRPIEEDRDDPTRTTWRSSAPQARKTPVEEDGTVLLVRGDVRISPQVLHSREARFEVKSDDPWPCDILALCVAGNFGNMRNGG